MKQVTMESVKQRIADLERARFGGLAISLQEERELACLRELVAVTEQRDALVVENSGMKANAIKADSVIMSSKFEYWSDRGELSEAVRLITETPANDTAIAALRAEGVEMFADSLKVVGSEEHPYSTVAREFARQLRESKGANHE